MKDIKTLCRDIHQNATEHGFYDDEHDIASIIALSFENSDTKNKLQIALADMAITQKNCPNPLRTIRSIRGAQATTLWR